MEITVLPIHFEDRSGVEFERLCLAYVYQLHEWISIDWYGQLGGDLGRDIWGKYETKENIHNVCFQCANHRVLKFKKAQDDINKIVKGLNGIPDEFILILGCNLSAKMRDKIKNYAGSIGILKTEIWSSVEFEERLRKDTPAIIDRFCKGIEFPETMSALKLFALESKLSSILFQMHKHMINLVNLKLEHTSINQNKFDRVVPVLMDNIGLVEISKWEDYKKHTQKRVRKVISRNPRKKIESWNRALGVASDVKNELIESKSWDIQDVVKVGEWLDLQNWGVGRLREKDNNWNQLYDLIKPYYVDTKLYDLIQKHIDFSFASCSIQLIYAYSIKWPNNEFLALLHQVLIGSPINRQRIDYELSQIISIIDQRLNEIEKEHC